MQEAAEAAGEYRDGVWGGKALHTVQATQAGPGLKRNRHACCPLAGPANKRQAMAKGGGATAMLSELSALATQPVEVFRCDLCQASQRACGG
jgi:hypothetical protein